MTTPTVPTAENIRPDQMIIVQGAVEFARTASLIEGEELERRVKNSKSAYPTESPHTLINLLQPEIVPADRTQLSWEEAYVQSLFYTHKKNPEKGQGFEAKNVTRNLPTLLAPDPNNPGAYRQIVEPEGEIAKGTIVRIVLKTFQSKDKNGRPHKKLGLGLEAILVATPEVPYAKAAARSLDLSSFGITISEPLVPTKAVEAETHSEIVGTDESGLPTAPTAPVAPQSAPAAPTAPAAPAAPAAPVVPASPAYQLPTHGAPAPTPAPVAQGNPDNPFAGAPAPNWGGTGIQPPA